MRLVTQVVRHAMVDKQNVIDPIVRVSFTKYTEYNYLTVYHHEATVVNFVYVITKLNLID